MHLYRLVILKSTTLYTALWFYKYQELVNNFSCFHITSATLTILYIPPKKRKMIISDSYFLTLLMVDLNG